MPRKKKRRVVRIKKPVIPKIEDLKAVANAKGMTTKEYVDHLAAMNRKDKGKVTLDLGPEPWKTKRGQYDRIEKGIKKR